MAKETKTRIKIKRATSTEWNTASTASSPFIPLDGELIYYTDTKVLKIGDGTNTPNNLPKLADGTVAETIAGLKYAGASSNGGAATSAVKLTTSSKGDSTTPVYFSSGKPVACGTLPYAAKTTDNYDAAAARKLTEILDGATAATPTSAGSTTNPVYFENGVPKATGILYAGSYSAGGPASKAVLLSDSNGTVGNIGNATTPIYVNSSGKPTACTGITLDTTGKAAKADKLTTARKFTFGGAVAANTPSFDGSSDVAVSVSSVKEAYLSWGGKNHANSYSPIDAAMVESLGANRFAFLNPAGVTIQYSRDTGSTWEDYAATDATKKALFGRGDAISIGKCDSTNKATANGNKYLARVIIETSAAQIYSQLNKFAIYVSTNGSTGSWCTIEAATNAAPNTWVALAQQQSIEGWSGWNVINTAAIETYGQLESQYQYIRFTFGATGGNTNYNGLFIMQICAFGGVGWTTPSSMAKTGHLYSYDNNQNAIFPAQVTSTGFNGNLTGVADKAKALVDTVDVGTASQPVYFKDGVPTICDTIPTVHTGSTTPASTLGKNGDIYVMPYATNIPAIYSGTAVPDHTVGVDGDIYIMY